MDQTASIHTAEKTRNISNVEKEKETAIVKQARVHNIHLLQGVNFPPSDVILHTKKVIGAL